MLGEFRVRVMDMETKDIITLGLSGSSFILSFAAIYLSHFRRAKITASLGPNIHIYYYPPKMVGIYLPVVFYNNSPTKGIVRKTFLEITDTNENNFALGWRTSNEIDKNNNYIEKGPAAPFKLDGYEAVTNALQFSWYNEIGAPELKFLEGSYVLRLHIWTSESLRPNATVIERFDISEEVATIMVTKLREGDTTTRFFPLAGKGLISFATGRQEVDFANLPSP